MPIRRLSAAQGDILLKITGEKMRKVVCGPNRTSEAIDFIESLRNRIRNAIEHVIVLDNDDIAYIEAAERDIHDRLDNNERRDYNSAMRTIKAAIPKHGWIISRDGKTRGVIVNPGGAPCAMAGCTGRRMFVRWEDGARTKPCTKGVTWLRKDLCKIE